MYIGVYLRGSEMPSFYAEYIRHCLVMFFVAFYVSVTFFRLSYNSTPLSVPLQRRTRRYPLLGHDRALRITTGGCFPFRAGRCCT